MTAFPRFLILGLFWNFYVTFAVGFVIPTVADKPCKEGYYEREPRPFISSLCLDATPKPVSENHRDDPGRQKKSTPKRMTWDESYELLLEYYEEHGHANVPWQYNVTARLGKWATNQRRNRPMLREDKIAKLDALNFTWDEADKEKANQKWQAMFQRLEEFKGKNGHLEVPRRSGKLSNWVERQRRQYTNNLLEQERIEKLESIGFVWRLRPFQENRTDKLEQTWEEMYEQLLLYKEENGDCNVPRPRDSLGNWVNRQRQSRVWGILRADREKRLESIGFVWSSKETYDEAWIGMFNKLKVLKEKLGGMDELVEILKRRETWASYTSSQPLHDWEREQQKMMLKGTLPIDREIMLREIGYWESLNLHKSEPSK